MGHRWLPLRIFELAAHTTHFFSHLKLWIAVALSVNVSLERRDAMVRAQCLPCELDTRLVQHFQISCFPLSTLGYGCCVFGKGSSLSHASLHSVVNEYLRWQCVRFAPCVDMAAVHDMVVCLLTRRLVNHHFLSL